MNPAAKFLALTPARRNVAIEQAATQRAISPVIMEKDFWVCWLLGVLFSEPTLAPHMVFKGGTSLSKAFGVIDRFSEDIDLSVAPAFVGADAEAFAKLDSRAKRDAAIQEMQALCLDKTRNVIAPALEAAITAAIGIRGGIRGGGNSGPWLSYEVDAAAHSPILRFHYPTLQTDGFAYLPRHVKLELGSLTDQQPVGQYSIRPWVAEAFPAVFDDWQCQVTVLELERTFWEKATILHAEYHRPADQPMPDRYARHYADMGRLLNCAQAKKFMTDKRQCERVVAWKSKVFARAWARYDLARHGSFRLAPPVERQLALAQDYAAMRPMFLTDPVPFDALIRQLTETEQIINAM